LKKDIEKSCLGLQFINDLKPVKYKMIQGSLTTDRPESKKIDEVMPEENITEKEGVRNHYGFIAQEVKEALDKNNEFDFAGWCLADKNDPESMQSLRYESFIAPLCKAIQELSAEVQTLKTQNQKLLQKLNIVLEEEPVIEETIVEEPIVEEPIVEETIVEEPIIEEPIVEETIVEEPIIEEPIIEESTLEPIAEETIIEENVIQE
jgi:hypothetical protein